MLNVEDKIDDETEQLRLKLSGSFLFFLKTFFPLVTGRDFAVSQPTGRESHHIELAKTFTKIQRQELFDIVINIPPGHGKSVFAAMFVVWSWTRYPDSQFLYISYAKDLAVKHTEFIRNFLLNTYYQAIFKVKLDDSSRAKDHFKNNFGGSVKAFGSQGAITGQDAGLPNLQRFSGAIILDDVMKPDEVHSDTIREKVIRNYVETIIQRKRHKSVPIISIMQRLHEADLSAYLLSENSEIKFDTLILKALDSAGNALWPDVISKNELEIKQQKSPYVFASQYQQDPIPAGGALFKTDYFVQLITEPEILITFITADTAETDKTYNDATVFSFFGLYEIEYNNQKTGQYGLHWLNCRELRVQPKDLEEEFLSFYADCMLHKVKPQIAAIERKSTGVTLSSTLSAVRGLKIIDVMRTKASGSKAVRYLEMQPILASKQISFTKDARHYEMCVNQLSRITANNTHAYDDIADTLYDAVKLSLIDKTIMYKVSTQKKSDKDGLLLAASRKRRLAHDQIWEKT